MYPTLQLHYAFNTDIAICVHSCFGFPPAYFFPRSHNYFYYGVEKSIPATFSESSTGHRLKG